MSEALRLFDDVESCVDAILAAVGRDLHVGLALGLGKPAELVNALYARAKADPSITLTLLTALSLEKPIPGSKLEAAFMQPFLDRVFAGVPDLEYAKDVSARRLPSNVRVKEFFFRPGSRLSNVDAQRDYISTNYTFAARDVFAQGCNVVMQAVAKSDTDAGMRYSLSCNPDTGPELIGLLRSAQARGERKVAVVGAVNSSLPYMALDAEVTPETFDFIVDDARAHSALFSTPKTPVVAPDYAIGLYASSLIRDGGTLQIGIGSLGDAIVHALRMRQDHNADYRAALDALGATQRHGAMIDAVGGTAPFETGLYGATEMFVDGFWHLMQGGILKRRVYDFWALQQLVNEGVCDPAKLAPDVLDGFVRLGVRLFRGQDFAVLQRHGFFRDDVRYDNGRLLLADGRQVVANVADPDARKLMGEAALGERLRGGVILHGGFFLGPRDFYEGLRSMTQEQRDLICMTGVDKVNQLDLNPRLYREQRIHARFINTGMMATLNGAVVSDGLADGRVVSGVGGQYNFVAQAHQLPTGRSILMVRAVRTPDDGGTSTSNLVTEYGHCTIPRHLRDVLITEYGIADLRAQTDSEVAKRLLNIADSRFQSALLAKLQAAGRIEAGYRIPDAFRGNTPEALADRLRGPTKAGHLPAFPFGTDFTEQELRLAKALKGVKARASSTPKWKLAIKALMAPAAPAELLPDLQRLGLEKPEGMEAKVARALLVEALGRP
ncbi:acetyl-CoA hydrolase/transferase-like protein [Panacagrimonas perspica]|uniref:Acetyl-CoA hydrolase/transferase-like protein n=1 Tax=Panacagrimonas perspica TaxID=381431 RepID=A0A4S3K9Q0_9GAMM|nr:acetyl-CoA hydrolase/transferase C-terminal domain-containing protein [Panacagrimonas perspica]TDU28710.1 acetyl-CoA hydrolase/transferase-like protein [Panacagrimonas perspica]THD05033.1 acetyl-CoA hydrolase [Panacagrimonas perspica]